MRHSSDFTHLLIYHVGPFVVIAVLFAGFLLSFRLARRAEKRRKGKLPRVEGVNRQRRRQERAMKRHARHY